MLSGVPVPAGRAADIEAAVLILYKISAAVELSENASREAPYVCRALAVSKEAALEAELSFYGIVRVAGLFTH